MTVDEAADHLRQMLRDAGFDFDHPDPALVWEVFKRFAVVQVESGNGRECEELWFEAGDASNCSPAFLDFVRMFSQNTENDAEYGEMVSAIFRAPAGVRLGREGIIHADLTDLPDFFRRVQATPSFRAGLACCDWSFEVRVDCC